MKIVKLKTLIMKIGFDYLKECVHVTCDDVRGRGERVFCKFASSKIHLLVVCKLCTPL